MSKKNYQRKIPPRKSLGQHFLKNEQIADKIANIFTKSDLPVLEVGPGTGALTEPLLQKYEDRLYVVEIDKRSIAYLEKAFPVLKGKIFEEDFLQMNIPKYFPKGVLVIGNFPYNISSQILFKVLDNAEYIPQFGGMFQKEVGKRICAEADSKDYGQLTLMREIEYDGEYLFDVQKHSFDPPPKVTSGVIKLWRNEKDLQGVTQNQLKSLIKIAFGQRRKMLRNSLKPFFTDEQRAEKVFKKRPENLQLNEFISLAKRASF